MGSPFTRNLHFLSSHCDVPSSLFHSPPTPTHSSRSTHVCVCGWVCARTCVFVCGISLHSRNVIPLTLTVTPFPPFLHSPSTRPHTPAHSSRNTHVCVGGCACACAGALSPSFYIFSCTHVQAYAHGGVCACAVLFCRYSVFIWVVFHLGHTRACAYPSMTGPFADTHVHTLMKAKSLSVC